MPSKVDEVLNEARVPAYLQIAAAISERIGEGVHGPGSRLPSESQFCAEFGVSAMTLRKALGVLAEQGLVYAEKGRGTFVRSLALGDTVFRLEELGSLWRDDSADIALLEAATTKADTKIAQMLKVEPGTRVTFLRRLIKNRGIPTMYHVEYIVFDARRPLVESQLQLTTLHGVLEAARGGGFALGRVILRAQRVDETAAPVLDMVEGTPVLCLEHVFEDHAQRPVSWGWFVMRADMFQLTAQLGPG